MFSTGSQRKYWMFKSEDELMNLRYEANLRFIQSRDNLDERFKDVPYEYFLSPSQERNLIGYYEKRLRKLCLEFQPPMPRSVVGTAFQFYKRFYLNNSVMDYHPKHILVTCVYLACKVEEFNVSMAQFVANIKGDRAKAADIVLNNELLLMQELKYHLTVHNPFRPVEGFLIDLKTRAAKDIDPEKFRPHIDTFIDKVFFTDACLLYSPSQIALASVVYAASMIKCGSNIEDYLTNLFADDPKKLETVQTIMRSILNMIKSNQRIEGVSKDQVIAIERKLENCRNQTNNPDSREYKRALQSQDNEEEPLAKYAKLSQEMQRDNDAYLNPTTSSSSARNSG